MLNALVSTCEQTCYGCPEQYEGQLVDGRWFYFRYRYGWASLAVGEDRDDVSGRQDVGAQVGDDLQGFFDGPAQRDLVFTTLLSRISDVPAVGGEVRD